MKVILLEDVAKLGKAGEVKEVRNGYGFNFLLPAGLAEFATPAGIKQSERVIAKRQKELETVATDAKTKAVALAGKTVTVKMKAENGKLFGSVGREEIAAAMSAMGIEADAESITIDKPFKELGTFPVEAKLGHGVKAAFQVTIEAA
ncbi:MAG: 50S ribosomal protein L9 [Candidatus Moranbacteria bacterium RIFCSPHIGHO2_12_FULL_54_9]|nr:MAG: 50S ribosomal protein L9 [Candidatus Moranbacteria bacterium RIFCSPHIGHO2_01_FULL_54_31]OGI25760.1 MAG: 50S ribosomal protein L9 [Candidatus Moranbacteria bacterium RIFCSPHIGHO2_12_FULL_54_9]